MRPYDLGKQLWGPFLMYVSLVVLKLLNYNDKRTLDKIKLYYKISKRFDTKGMKWCHNTKWHVLDESCYNPMIK